MRIVIQDFVLCAGVDESEYVEAWDEQSQESVQMVSYLRATAAKAFPRGNTRTDISFSISRQHADFRTCEEFLLTHHRLIPKSGTVLFISEGGGQGRFTLSDAALVSTSRRQIGLTSIHTYRLAGGDFTEGT